MRRIACLHFPFWPIQRRIARHPELRFQRIVLEERHPQRGKLVAWASPLALRCGVALGMPVVEARSLLLKSGDSRRRSRKPLASFPAPPSQPDRGTGDTQDHDEFPHSPTFHIFPHEPAVDRQELEQLARQLDSFSPLVGLDTSEPLAALLLDVTGLAPLFGSEQDWLHRVLATLSRWGYVVQGAIGPTIGTAWALAHHPAANIDPQAGQIATEFSWTLLDHLHPVALRIEPAICQTLDQLGLTTIAALRRIPSASLTVRFGDQISRRLREAAGELPETFRSLSTAESHQAQRRFDYPLRDQPALLAQLEDLIGQVCQGLLREGCGALGWRIRLGRSSAPPTEFEIGLCQATSRVAEIISLVAMQLEHQRLGSDEASAVEQIDIAALGCTRLVERQRELFDDQPRRHEAALGQLLNRLAIRLGEDNVLSAACVAGAQPERAVEYRPRVGPRAVTPRATKARPQSDLLRRPVRLLPQPLEITVRGLVAHAGEPAWGGTAPAAFEIGGDHFAVSRWWGPERIETGWWYGRTVRRDYWRVETMPGTQFWIFCELRSRRWFLHGAF